MIQETLLLFERILANVSDRVETDAAALEATKHYHRRGKSALRGRCLIHLTGPFVSRGGK